MSAFKERVAEAIDLSDEGRHKQALTKFNALIKAFPNEPQAYFERAMTLMNLDRDEDAAVDLEKALALDPAYPGARDWLARAAAGQGKPLLAAETKLKELIETKRDGSWAVSPQKWADCAGYFLKAGSAERAREVLDIYFAQHAEKVDAYKVYVTAPLRTYAEALLSLGNPQMALRYAERAVGEAHKVAADEFIWIRCFAHTGQIEKAKQELDARASYAGTLPYNQAKSVLDALSR
jgi:predicted Zn-dependent protease